MNNEWTHLSLFTGIGAIDLAFEWAGFKTVGQIEIADWPYLKLTEIWPDVPKWRNVKRVTKKSLARAGIKSQITVLSGGFPCQPFSTSGKRQGKADDRHLWPEMFRLVKECRPAWVLGENVTGIIGMELDNALADLESAGYTCRAFNIPAVAVGAWHERKRVFIVATNTGYDAECAEQYGAQEVSEKLTAGRHRQLHSSDVSNSTKTRSRGIPIQQGRPRQKDSDADGNCPAIPDPLRFEWSQYRDISGMGWSREQIAWFARSVFECEPGLGRVVHGIPGSLDEVIRQERCNVLGNAVVPQQIYPVAAAIAATIERSQGAVA